jgi:broad specificity phosphatase PhoE
MGLTASSAGSRDSDLTNHGFQQATRLGRFLQSTGVEFTHVFSSHLKRAVKTAELIASAQASSIKGNVPVGQLKQVPLLAEQDFGSYEGVSFIARPSGSSKGGKETHREVHKNDPGFVDMESKDSMALRTDRFLEDHLFPLLEYTGVHSGIAIVSHGIILSVLWSRLLQRLPPRSVTFRSELLATHGRLGLERLGGWSNTGYLEVELLRNEPLRLEPALPLPQSPEATIIQVDFVKQVSSTAPVDEPVPEVGVSSPRKVASATVLTGWTTIIHAVNSKTHLVGLKRTGGGVGSSRHDDNQKSIESFFKKRKVG